MISALRRPRPKVSSRGMPAQSPIEVALRFGSSSPSHEHLLRTNLRVAPCASLHTYLISVAGMAALGSWVDSVRFSDIELVRDPNVIPMALVATSERTCVDATLSAIQNTVRGLMCMNCTSNRSVGRETGVSFYVQPNCSVIKDCIGSSVPVLRDHCLVSMTTSEATFSSSRH